jgi:anti-sigma factor RsiW
MMNQEILEMLIGKHFDGEITPGEERILEMELARDPRAAELLAELQDLHERSSELVASCILGQGTAPGDIIEQAWQRTEKPVRSRAKRAGYVHAAVGVAAGFVIGLAAQFVLPSASTPQNNPAVSEALVRNTGSTTKLEEPNFPELPAGLTEDPIRNVDWYNFTDSQGNQWLIEGLREDTAQPTAYYGDL